ncbi:hypothetical protein [Natronosalvus rutilus]|uniref:Uncharacterized protein n=1 Tax=Natronosalvus rutilus TaxID=2953753 RepID=A0A9E7NCN9_9EURY|nr:hypothetical protein [Natronosalvus rutilus]UTF54936.1 hypothetical protein NGM29_06685 [Natronosalvus rutilus]
MTEEDLEDPPAGWHVEIHRRYTPATSDREMTYVTYRHESGDLRVRVAPASIDGDDRPGYAITTTTYPELESSDGPAGDGLESTSRTIRSVFRFPRCDELARRFMSLFETAYDGPATFERALAYATDRVRASDAHDAPVDVDGRGTRN